MPKRLMAVKESRVVVERQFRWVKAEAQEHKDRKISEWFLS
jgi:hypothetical protein